MNDNPDSVNTDAPLKTASPPAACGTLTLALLVVFPLFAWYGHSRHGMLGVQAATVAGSICWAGGMLALLAVVVVRGSQKVLHGALLGMIFRMGLPLGAGVVLTSQGGDLANAGVFGMILGFYLVTLVVETLLSLRFVAPAGKMAEAS